MTFRSPELNQLFQEILKRPRGQQATAPPVDPRVAMARLLRVRRQQTIRQVTR